MKRSRLLGSIVEMKRRRSLMACSIVWQRWWGRKRKRMSQVNNPNTAAYDTKPNPDRVRYRPQDVEPKWQRYWLENKTFRVIEDPTKPKYYILDMFPYPS